jgi:alkylation response protein AidB-like acyl-CoA dehydrogenase
MIEFELTEDQRLVQGAARDLAKTLRERMRESEEARTLPDDLRATFAELGFPLAALPESVGGQGLGMVGATLIEEELAYGDPAAPYASPGPGAFGRAVLELGTEEQAKSALADVAGDAAAKTFGAVAWSEAKANKERAGFLTTAKREGDAWAISGKKAFVQNAEYADRFVVFAQVDDAAGWGGIGAFVVKRGDGVRVGARHETLGLNAVSFGEVTFENARVKDADRLLGGADFTASCLRFFVKQALVVGARASGLAHAAFDVSRDYAETRKAFGKPIGHFQAVAFKLSDRLIDADSARWMLWRAAWAWDEKRPEKECLKLTAHAVAHALEAAMRCGDDAVQLHGGAGFMRDYPVEKMMRDAKQMALTCPTAEQLDQLAAALSLGVALDPALVLPTPDSQAIFT